MTPRPGAPSPGSDSNGDSNGADGDGQEAATAELLATHVVRDEVAAYGNQERRAKVENNPARLIQRRLSQGKSAASAVFFFALTGFVAMMASGARPKAALFAVLVVAVPRFFSPAWRSRRETRR